MEGDAGIDVDDGMELSYANEAAGCSLDGSRCGGSPGPAQMLAGLSLKERPKPLSDKYLGELPDAMTSFHGWSEADQVDFVKQILAQMCHYQHGQINAYLKPMLQRDFLSLLPARGLHHIAEQILSYLDARALCSVELVCREWRRVSADGQAWKRLIQRKVRTDSMWRGLSEKRGWKQYLSNRAAENLPLPAIAPAHPAMDTSSSGPPAPLSPAPASPASSLLASSCDVDEAHRFYRALYPLIVVDIETIENNWKCGRHVLQKIVCQSENSKGVYCLQYDDHKIISGLRDNTIKLWNRDSLECEKVLTGHTGSVLCLQYDGNMIVSGSSDSTVRVWDVTTGELINTLIHHCEAVLHLRFQDGMMVTCSKDRSIAVWDMGGSKNGREIALRRVLVGHRAAVNVVDFDEKYIVSASGDRTIKVWGADTCEFVRTLSGHKRGIACLQYRDRLVVSGSSDNTIKLWDIECGACLRTLEGHEELVRCIRFDSKRIVSGAYDGKIKVWDLAAALDPRSPPNTICLRTLVEHTGRVFRLQFDEFQIVSSSHDDTILVWDFLNYKANPPGPGPIAASNVAAQALPPPAPAADDAPAPFLLNAAPNPPPPADEDYEADEDADGAPPPDLPQQPL